MDLFDPEKLVALKELGETLCNGLHNRDYEDSLRAGTLLFEMMPSYMTFHFVLLSLFRLDLEVADIQKSADLMLRRIELTSWERMLVRITAGTIVDIRDLLTNPATTAEKRCQLCYYMGCRLVYLGQGEAANHAFSVCAVTDAKGLEKSLAMGECETRGITVDDETTGRSFHGSRQRQETMARNDAVGTLVKDGQFATALPLAKEALALARQNLGENHIATSASHNCVGVALRGLDRLREALPHFEAAHQIQKRVLGVRNPDVITSLEHLAKAHRQLGDNLAASRCLEDVIKIRRRWRV